MKKSNTITAFIRTSEVGQPPITCPGCGQLMSLQIPSSYRRILVEKVRLNLDRLLQGFARNIEQLENDLEILNLLGPSKLDAGEYPHLRELKLKKDNLKENGVYTESVIYAAAVEYAKFSDTFEHREFIFNKDKDALFPRRRDLQDRSNYLVILLSLHLKNDSGDKFSLLEFLIRGFEKASSIGPLMNLVLTQDEILKWVAECTLNEEKFNLIDDLVKSIVPNIHQYLNEIQEDVKAEIDKNNPEENEKSDLSESSRIFDYIKVDHDASFNIQRAIKRIKITISLLLGHYYRHDINIPLVKYGKRFSLPKLTEVKIFILPELMASDLVLKQCGINWNKSLTSDDNLSSKKNDEKNVSDLIKIWKDEIFKLLNFTCTGPSGRLQSDVEASIKFKYCGWHPKQQQTHPIIFLGSPGTGKSTAMQSGISNLRQAITSIGCTITFNNPESSNFLKEKRKLNQGGKLPPPTKEGERFSIDFSIEATEKIQGSDLYSPIVNYIFTDIPGETVNRLFNEEGADSVLLGILDNAETIVLFYDLSVDPDFRNFFTDNARPSLKEIWGKLLKSYNKAYKDRNPSKLADGEPLSESNISDESVEAEPPFEGEDNNEIVEVSVSQSEVLNKLIKAIVGEESIDILPESGKQPNGKSSKIDANFVCVLTKADLFADFGGADRSQDYPNDTTLFLTSFFQALRDRFLLIDPSGHPDTIDKNGKKIPVDFDVLQSQGGIGYLEPKSKVDNEKKRSPETYLLQQKSIINFINTEAVNALRKIEFATMLPNDVLGGSDLEQNDLSIAGKSMLQNIEINLIEKLYKYFDKDRVYFLPVSPAGKSIVEESPKNRDSEEGNPLRQKLSEYIFLLPIVLSLLKNNEGTGKKQPQS